jgi:hypothetical protein
MRESMSRPTISSSDNAGRQRINPFAAVKRVVENQSSNVVQDTRSIEDCGHTSECVEADYQGVLLTLDGSEIRQ